MFLLGSYARILTGHLNGANYMVEVLESKLVGLTHPIISLMGLRSGEFLGPNNMKTS